jgi:HK97 family phage prohead protease
MSDTKDERPMLVRTFRAFEVEADGRNLEMLCAPFDQPATVADPPHYLPYQEAFAPGAFDGATRAPNRVLLEFEHWHPGMSGILGHGVEFEQRDDGLYGRLRVSEHPDGDKALTLIRDGVLGAASVMFEPIKSALEDGVVRRLKVHLDRVALCREGAYPEAKVLAVRSKAVIERPATDFDPELAERLAGLGIIVPDKLKAATA